MSDENSTIVVEPRKESFDLPSPFVTAHWPSILGGRPLSIRAMRRDHFDSTFPELFVEPVAVVGHVPDYSLRKRSNETTVEQLLDKRHFMRRSTLDAYGDRKTSAVCDCHDLRTLAPLGFPNTRAPFFAEAKVPSTKHSVKSIPPRSRKSRARLSMIRLITLALTHCWNRRWHVWYGGYRSGRSCHGAPVLIIQRIPLRTERESFQGRPRPSARRFGFGISGSRTDHCSSVKSITGIVHYHYA